MLPPKSRTAKVRGKAGKASEARSRRIDKIVFTAEAVKGMKTIGKARDARS